VTDEDIRQRILRAYGLKAWQAGVAPVPWPVRLWRAVTFAYRRGKAIDWRSYNAAEKQAREQREAFAAALPERAREIAADLSRLLPDGMTFEWRTRGQ
jgi:hypothetical protein